MSREDLKALAELLLELGAMRSRVEASDAAYEKRIAALTAERDSLKAEVEKSGRDWNTARDAHDRRVSEINDLKAEVAMLEGACDKCDLSVMKANLETENRCNDELKAEIVRLNEIVDRLHKSACRAGDERDGLAFANSQLREAVEVALPRFCANTCEHDDNYGSVKYHDMECANIRRLLGQDVGENGRIRDAGEEKRI